MNTMAPSESGGSTAKTDNNLRGLGAASVAPKSSDEHSSAAPSKWPFVLTIGLCAVVLVISAVRLLTTGHASVFIVLMSVGVLLQQVSMFTRRPSVTRLLRYGGAVAILAAAYLAFRGVP